ncbi:MAG: hypothetical protein MK082_12050 [Phycisphaerales bacterium]|nr:hypothetical protein [Phycisphaerales bacterium]
MNPMQLLLIFQASILCAALEPSGIDPPVVVSPPPAALVERLGLDDFYAKCTMVRGLPILSSSEVDDRAHLEAAWLITRMLEHRPEVIEAVGASGTRFVIMAPDEMTTDVPEHSDLTPPDYWDKRARGLGATDERPAVSCGEENLLQFPGDPYKTENILIHEFAHAIHEMGMRSVDPTFDARLGDVFNAAMEEGLWDGVYASTNRMEYWAEGVQSWFDTNRENDDQHNHVNTREELKAYDPRLADLVEEVFGDLEWRYVGALQRVGTDHLAGWDPGRSPTFAWPEEVTAAYEAHERSRHHLARRDGESRIDHLRRKAERGDAVSQVTLGWLLRRGDGVDQDDEEAVRWYRRAAEQGAPGGLDSLGWMYEVGRGVEQDELVAVSLYRLSAARGHRQAMWNLGRMLEAGLGVSEPDPVEGLAWIMLASQGGHRWATEHVNAKSSEATGTLLDDARRRMEELASSPAAAALVE